MRSKTINYTFSILAIKHYSKYLAFLTSFFLANLTIPSSAHELPRLHTLCRDHKDYKGCIESNSSLVVSPIARDKESNGIRKYGPITIDFSVSQTRDLNTIFPALNSSAISSSN